MVLPTYRPKRLLYEVFKDYGYKLLHILGNPKRISQYRSHGTSVSRIAALQVFQSGSYHAATFTSPQSPIEKRYCLRGTVHVRGSAAAKHV